MTINKDDIKVYVSQRLTDEDNGGGRATGNLVVDGEVNNLFRDIRRWTVSASRTHQQKPARHLGHWLAFLMSGYV